MVDLVFLVRKVYQSMNTTMRWGEVFVGHNLICYFGEQSVANGMEPSPLIVDGKYTLSATMEGEDPSFTLTNNSGSIETSLDLERSGNGIWLTDQPQGLNPADPIILATKFLAAIDHSVGGVELAVRFVSWTLGNVIHRDAQSYSAPQSDLQYRKSFGLKVLTDGVELPEISQTRSGECVVSVGDYVYRNFLQNYDHINSIRIEFLIRSDPVNSLNVRARTTGNADWIEGKVTSVSGDQKKVVLLITSHKSSTAQDGSSGTNYSDLRSFSYEIGGSGVYSVIRIRTSFYKADPISSWEIDGQLTKVRIKNGGIVRSFPVEFANAENETVGVPIEWELVSGKPVDLSFRIHNWFWDLYTVDPEDSGPTVAFDYGTGDERNGVLEIARQDVAYYSGARRTSLLIDPSEYKNNRFRDRDDDWLAAIISSTEVLQSGSISPFGTSEADAIGYQELPGVEFGTGEYIALLPKNDFEYELLRPLILPGISDSNENWPIVMTDTLHRLNVFGVAESPSIGVRIIKAWIPPEEASKEEWAHAQGRAVDFIAIDRETGEAMPEFLGRFASIASKLFDWVEYVAENTLTGEQAHIHASRRFEAPTICVPTTIADLGDPNRALLVAQENWNGVSDFDDVELLDQLIAEFPNTAVATAAFSHRYQLLEESIVRLRESDFKPENYDEWKSESDIVIRECHRLLSRFPGNLASEDIRIQLLILLRRLEDAHEARLEAAQDRLVALDGADAAGVDAALEEKLLSAQLDVYHLEMFRRAVAEYHEFAVRYPTTPEGRIAFIRLYAIESRRVLRMNSTEECLSFLRNYPDAPQWNEIAAYAEVCALDDERNFVAQVEREATTEAVLNEAEFNDHIRERGENTFRSRAAKITEEMAELLVEEGDTPTDATRETTSVYLDPDRARLLMTELLRLRHVTHELKFVYIGFYADIVVLMKLFSIEKRLAGIEIQIGDLRSLVVENHSQITDLVISEGKLTRELVSDSFLSLAESQAQLHQALNDGFNKIDERFDEVDSQLVEIREISTGILNIAENILAISNELMDKSDLIINNLDEARAQRSDLFEAVLLEGELDAERHRVTVDAMTRLGDVAARSASGRPSRKKGPVGTFVKWVKRGGKKAKKFVIKEVKNVSINNVRSWVRNPARTMSERVSFGQNIAVAETNRAVKSMRSAGWFRLFEDLGEDLFLENPGSQMKTFKPSWPHKGFQLNDLQVDLPDYDENAPIYFVNGLNNSQSQAEEHAQFLSNLQNAPVRLIRNYSSLHDGGSTTPPGVRSFSYGNNDFLEAIYDRLWPAAVLGQPLPIALQIISGGTGRAQGNPTTRYLAYQIYHDTRAQRSVRVVVHSQGTLILRNALLACTLMQGNVKRVSCVLAGSALSTREMIHKSELANLTWLVNRRDPVAAVVGFKTDISGLRAEDAKDRIGHNFSNGRGDVYGGEALKGKPTYVRLISPEHLVASDQPGSNVYA